jgi:Protein of unknown function (DUF1566)
MKTKLMVELLIGFMVILCAVCVYSQNKKITYPIVDTGQVRCYDDRNEIIYSSKGQCFAGQDAQYAGNLPQYRDNGDGTISDLVTGLMWQKNPGSKKGFTKAVKGASKCRTGEYRDWRLPTIKELYSLIMFNGLDPDPRSVGKLNLRPFIDTEYFDFKYGNTKGGERIIDSQFATSTKYVHKTMRGDDTMFGVNFADGRIKGYPITDPRSRKEKGFYVLYVRGNKNYGENKFVDNHDGTVTDQATGLTWMKGDSKKGMNWKEALAYAAKLKLVGKNDWRLPNAKELQSIVDYTRSPVTTNSAAINRIFKMSTIKSENGKKDYPYYWAGTTHAKQFNGSAAVYISFGKALGWMRDRRSGKKTLLDVHGAGSQRSDQKSGNPKKFPYGRGPQGDVIRINNYVKCVRGGKAEPVALGPAIQKTPQRLDISKGLSGSKGSEDTNVFVKRLDKDGDGKVSKKEFDGPKQHFSHLDKNGDGFLSGEEVLNVPSRRR